ncbi:hypothetical protein KPL71_015173 [Citrus sinensis]|uniref:Uncharacterized protein n=1 Tax=Citrus sinensis TaxID=2711 RepID=A0ACB8KH13_CITSI|nr:hypothetical protein KPL71_015173 [Citrus sinensis]
MSTNKERIERVEAEIGSLQDGMKRMELGLTDRLHRLEETMSKLVDSLPTSKGMPSHNNSDHVGSSQPSRGDSEGSRHQLASRLTKLECPRYSGDDPTEWVKQTGSLRDYQREFERLGNWVRGWTQKALVGTFMGGLKPAISEEIRMFRPKTLKEAISLARMKDDQLTRQRKLLRPQYLNRTPPTPTNNTRAQPTRPIKRLTWDEMQRHRVMGLCFNCNDRFTAGHKCTQPQLLLLETPRTMRVTATVGPYEIMVLIDSGSTHNFISSRMANMLRLPIIPTAGFLVRVANGETLSCKGKFERVQWLEMLGSVVCNWKQLTMDFTWENKSCRLQVIGPQSIQTASLTEITKELRQGQSGFAICFHVNVEDSLNTTTPDMQDLLKEYNTLFQKPTKLPPRREIDHNITLKEGTEPVNVRPYRYAYFQKAEIKKQVQEMLNSGLIRPSTSPFSSPVLLVKKKDGSWRFCTDYRSLNNATVKDRFPIPTVDDMLDELHGAAYFTKLDLRAGYHQVRVNPADIHKTAFRTYNGHYEYLVMPFGLCNAPSTFQAIMNSIFRPYLRKFILVFFDDILIYSPSWCSHLTHVKQAMEVLKQHQFFLKASKCTFGQQELEYLGHIITSQGVKVDETKIAAMVSWPQPKNISELRGFLGLTGYYRKFVQGYGVLARPLTNLLKKGQFEWNAEADKAFINLKKAMTSTPTLAMPNFNETFIIVTDASGDGIGAILQQQGHPIAFMSRALGVTKKS